MATFFCALIIAFTTVLIFQSLRAAHPRRFLPFLAGLLASAAVLAGTNAESQKGPRSVGQAPTEELSITLHRIVVGGETIDCTAPAGNLALEQEEKPAASMSGTT